MPSITHEPWCKEHTPSSEAGTEICGSGALDVGERVPSSLGDDDLDWTGYVSMHRALDDDATTVWFYYRSANSGDQEMSAGLVNMLVAAMENDPADLLAALKVVQSAIASEQVLA